MRSVSFVFICTLVGACSRPRAHEADPTPALAAAPTAQAPAPAADPAQPAAATGAKELAPARDVAPLFARMRYEAEHRPSAQLPVERVFDALDKAGIAVGERTQYAGVTMKASYCAGGHTSDGLVVSLCEYPTHEAAIAGKSYMDKSFPLASAKREVRDSTVMTAVGAGNDRAIATFQTL